LFSFWEKNGGQVKEKKKAKKMGGEGKKKENLSSFVLKKRRILKVYIFHLLFH
jgi:hypothetical protein